jgi:trigger factor
MQVSVENAGGLERRLTVQVPEAEILEKVESRLRQLSKEVRIKGFRPGRVPMSVVQQRYGKQVRAEIVNETIQSSLQQAIQDEKLRPASMPRLDGEPGDINSGDLEFQAIVEIYPEMGTLDVASLEIYRPETEVSEDDVDEMMLTLRNQRQEWEPVERTAQEGEQVLIEYVAETDEGRVPEEGRQRLAIIMGDSGFDELEKAVSEISPGEEKEALEISFPDDYREPSLAGNTAKVDLSVVSVSVGKIPEVDEAFINSFGVEDGTEESLRKEIRANLERELKQATNSLLKLQLIGELVKSRPDLEVPESIVRQEAASMAAQVAQSQGLEPDPAMAEAFMEQAQGRVRGGLLLGELAQQNGIRIDGARVRQAIETLASTYEQSADVVQLYYSNQQLLQQVENSVLEEQVVDWVMENAKVNPREMKFQEVINEAAQANR